MRKRRGGRYKEPPDPAIVEENTRRWLEYGKGDVHSLEFEDLAALTIEASLISGVRLAGE